MDIPRLDPNSPVPLYHQIAQALRARIEAGHLPPGEALEPMRAAAERLGVNMHTVRHAYAALARDGLVEMRGARGTRVTARPAPPRRGEESAAFVQRIVAEAAREHAMTPAQLAARIAGIRDTRPTPPSAAVIECSALQCESHAAELQARFRIAAEPFSLDRDGQPDADALIATWFHYNDVRRRWPHLLASIDFVTIRPDVSFAARLDAEVRALAVVEIDRPTGEAVCGDLEAALPAHRFRLEVLVAQDPTDALADLDPDTRAVFSPRTWSRLGARARADQRAIELRYVFDADELTALGARHGWPPPPSPDSRRN